MLRRIDTFDPFCFLYASLSRISKAKNAKRSLLQTDNFLQSSDKKATCLMRRQLDILRIYEKQRIKLSNFVNFLKKKHFLHLKTTIIFFWFYFAVLKEWNTFESNSVSFLQSCSLKPTITCFASLKVISNRDLQTVLHPSINYWFQ